MHCIIFFALCLMAGCSTAVAQVPAESASVTHYDFKPDHLWNRLYAGLLPRPDADGKTVGQDSLDPLVFPTTKRLLDGPTHVEAVKLLDEFLTDGHKLVRDPVKRAVMQRDLWALFDWAAFPFGNFYTGGDSIKIRTGPLQERLAKAIRLLAPSKAEAEALPDTYALAVKSKEFPVAFNPAKPNDPWLPPNLFDAAGPWVCVTGPLEMSTPLASEHASVFAGRSAFLVFIKLPEGRQATLAYLASLNTFPKPWKVPPRQEADEEGRRPTAELNPDVPQFPVGTQIALVRQLVIVTDEAQLVPTRITESVQLRTFRKIAARSREHEEQAFVELKLHRADLFAGKAGGLRATVSDDLIPSELTFFRSWTDPFEEKTDDTHSRPVLAFHSCAACHSQEGIHSVNSYKQSGASRQTIALGLFPTSVADVSARSAEWKTGLKDWFELKKLAGW